MPELTKRELLLAICENPGWAPATEQLSSSLERMLSELHAEGWTIPRMDGWEATPEALGQFPHFPGQADIADGSASVPEATGSERETLRFDIDALGVLCTHCLSVVRVSLGVTGALQCQGCSRTIGHVHFWA